MATAAIGVFVAFEQASRAPTNPIVVAARDLRPGQVLELDDLRTIEGDLPDLATDRVFASIDRVEGRVVLGPIAEGEIVQAGSLTDQSRAADLHEVAMALPRTQLAARPG